jgi:hypothetical protein
MLNGVDWPTFGAAFGMFVTTSLIAWKGWQDKKGESKGQGAQIVGGMIADNVALTMNTEQLRTLNEELRDFRADVRANTAALTRAADIAVFNHR